MTHLAPDIERLVERQLRNWELSRAQRLPSPPTKEVHDFVAISRQVGSRGSDVGRILADRLHWPLFDREILQAMAGNNELRQQLYEAMDERDMSWLAQTLEWLLGGRFPPQDYFSQLSRCVLALARGGHAVFLGRAADLILPRKAGFRLRIVAPLDQRVRTFAERRGVDAERAREEVLRIDRERADFIRNHFRREVDDPTRCDLTLNMEHFTTTQATDVILRILQDRGITQ
jgi:cytidylate kinase